MIFKKVINFIYLNFPNIYIYLKKNIKKQINFPMNPHIFFKKNLNKNAIIVEAGAADGWDTLFFAKEFPNASIYSLEPVKELHETLTKKTSNFTNVHIFKLAFDFKSDNSIIYIPNLESTYYGAASLLLPDEVLNQHPDIDFSKKENVQTITLDEFLLNQNINKIDLLWFDLQGKEPDVLFASKKIHLINYIYTEVSVVSNYKNQKLYPELKKFLINHNFKIIFEDIRWEDGGNVLFKNKKFF